MCGLPHPPPRTVLVLFPDLGFKDPSKFEDSELRFPSTHAVAWIEQKERLVALTAQEPHRFAPLFQSFNAAVNQIADQTLVPRGRHVLACHEDILVKGSSELANPMRTFLRLDGTWLDEGKRERDEPTPRRRELSPAEEARLWENLAEARRQLQEAANEVCPGRIRLGRTPPIALLRADADRLGRLQGEAVQEGGLERATQLSDTLARDVLPTAVAVVEKCGGKVIFAGGDELLAMLPAAYALQAAAKVAQAYEQGSFPKLTASVAILVTDPRQPLRGSLTELTTLLESAKNHTRLCSWDGDGRRPNGCEFSREAFGLAVVPGSGNVKRGVIGLRVPRGQSRPTQTCNALTDVLLPLAEALALPPAGRVSISPRLYREWIELFDIEEVHQTHLPAALLPTSNDEGIALAEFRRLARRHLTIRETVAPDQISRDWLQRLTGEDVIDNETLAVVDGLTDRVRSLLMSGSIGDNRTPCDDANWADASGLLLGMITLGTREIR